MTYSCSDFASDVLATMVEAGALPEEAGNWEPGEAADAVCAAIKRMAGLYGGNIAPQAAAVPLQWEALDASGKVRAAFDSHTEAYFYQLGRGHMNGGSVRQIGAQAAPEAAAMPTPDPEHAAALDRLRYAAAAVLDAEQAGDLEKHSEEGDAALLALAEALDLERIAAVGL